MITLEQIYASKIFQSSSRQKQILSAFNTSAMSPMLTIQSPISVAPEYRKNTVRPKAEAKSSEGAQDSNESIKPSKSSGSSHGGGGFSGGPSDVSFDDLAGLEDIPEEALSDDSSSDSGAEESVSLDSQEPVEEATGIDVELNLNE